MTSLRTYQVGSINDSLPFWVIYPGTPRSALSYNPEKQVGYMRLGGALSVKVFLYSFEVPDPLIQTPSFTINKDEYIKREELKIHLEMPIFCLRLFNLSR